jgi:hypothetical protein
MWGGGRQGDGRAAPPLSVCPAASKVKVGGGLTGTGRQPGSNALADIPRPVNVDGVDDLERFDY